MDFKKDIIMAMATGLLGMALISGGTFSYFSDEEQTQAEIASGTVDLGLKKEDGDDLSDDYVFEFDNKQPGDTFFYKIQLQNNGTLDIGEIQLTSEHQVTKGEKNFGSQIIINNLEVDGTPINSIIGDSLDKLNAKNEPIVLMDQFEKKNVEVFVEFKFIEEGNQNDYQGNSLELKWNFIAM